ncbi:hypothetical protein C1752_10215 [Acaryochloris thomasi RCC1774]|uniref:SH3b domain-containing protein n=2 Tax=Acaryochloris TaxID=155977 RepID=A0A2W1J8S9_9CYAN|nr:hypothetical protein C1752_10215 [Acaryochloris thomasi RCC1774]
MMNSRTVLLSLLVALLPSPAFALPFKTGDYICPRNSAVEIRAGVKIEPNTDPLKTLQANPPEKRKVLGRIQKGQCMVVIENKRNGFKSGGFTWYNVYSSSIHGWTAGEFYDWAGNLLNPEEKQEDEDKSVISNASK